MSKENPVWLMPDLESLGTQPDAAILGIGATYFTKEGVVASHRYMVNIDDAIKHGRVCGDNLKWWMRQSEHARNLNFNTFATMSLREALEYLFLSYADHKCVGIIADPAHFDVRLIEYAATRAGMYKDIPWKYWEVVDLKSAVRMLGIIKTSELDKLLTKKDLKDRVDHDCQSDSKIQALGIIRQHQKARRKGEKSILDRLEETR